MPELYNIPAARPLIGEEERSAVDRVLRSGLIAQGPEVAAFEAEFSERVGDVECVAVNSGTSALHLMLLAFGIGPGDEVIVPSFTFAATANCVALTGATPVFVDIELDSFCVSPDAVSAAITPRTKAIMPVHLFGHPADMTTLSQLADKHSLLLFEDAAQAHLATHKEQPVGSIGSAGAFSFYPTKNMTAAEGGMVTTSSSEAARKVRLLRNQGMERRYENELVGLNNRMTDIHASIGRVQLAKLRGWTDQRQQNAEFFTKNLVGVQTPTTRVGDEHVFHQYTIRVSPAERDSFCGELSRLGVGTGVYYPTPVHRLPSFDLTCDLPATEQLAAECVSLPVYPGLSDDELDHIVSTINKVAGAGA